MKHKPALVGAAMFSACCCCCRRWDACSGAGPAIRSRRNVNPSAVRIPGVRGRIFDRTGACLADNRPSYGIAVYVEELRQPGRLDNTVKAVRRLLDQVGEKIGKPTPVSDRQIEEHLHSRRALPLTAWRNLSLIEMARLAEAGIGLHAADIVVDAERVYPQSETAGHLLGYVGKREYTTGEEPYHYYLPDLTGRAGLGGALTACWADAGTRQRVGVPLSISARQPSDDLILSLDLTAQRAAEHALQGAVGAAVVLDPSNGDVLALASSPAIDPNWFCPILPQKVWSGLLADTDKPLLNRAVAGVYPPGSIFKPVVALAALEHGAISRGYTVNCRGVLPLGRRTFACYHGHAHGTIGLRRALEISCNVYFYLAGLECGIDAIQETAQMLGLGQRTGIDAEGERPGLTPARVEAPRPQRWMARWRYLQYFYRSRRAVSDAHTDGCGYGRYRQRRRGISPAVGAGPALGRERLLPRRTAGVSTQAELESGKPEISKSRHAGCGGRRKRHWASGASARRKRGRNRRR